MTLREASEGKAEIKLSNGEYHSFSQEEVYRLLYQTPEFLWDLIRIPLLLRYEVTGTLAYYKVLGDRWQQRLAEIMLEGKYTYKGRKMLRVSEFQQIIRKFKSLIFVSLSI